MNKILNFGSLNLDFVYKVDHFVKAGETLSATDVTVNCGGKGLNQSIAAARAGAEVYHAGKIGHDGETLREMLRQSGVDTSYVSVSDGQSGNAVIQVDKDGQNCILIFAGNNRNITEAEIDACLGHFGEGDYLILQNEINNIPYLMKAAFGRGMKIVFNPSPATEELKNYPLDTVSLLVLNEIEGEMLTGERCPDNILSSLRKMYPSTDVLLTLGSDGSVYSDGKQTVRHGIYKVTPVDTTGAGDTMLGYFTAGLAAGMPAEKVIDTAAKAAAIAVTRAGAAVSVPTAKEVEDAELVYMAQ